MPPINSTKYTFRAPNWSPICGKRIIFVVKLRYAFQHSATTGGSHSVSNWINDPGDKKGSNGINILITERCSLISNQTRVLYKQTHMWMSFYWLEYKCRINFQETFTSRAASPRTRANTNALRRIRWERSTPRPPHSTSKYAECRHNFRVRPNRWTRWCSAPIWISPAWQSVRQCRSSNGVREPLIWRPTIIFPSVATSCCCPTSSIRPTTHALPCHSWARLRRRPLSKFNVRLFYLVNHYQC